MSSLCSLIRSAIGCGALAALVFTLFPAVVSAQSVRGQGEIVNGDGVSNSHISVYVWIDASGNV